MAKNKRVHPLFLLLQAVFFLLGLVALGYYGYVVIETEAIQAYEKWSFERELSGRKPTVGGYLRSLLGKESEVPAQPPSTQPSIRPPEIDRSWTARIQIPRLRVSAMVLQGVDRRTLRRAVGHIPGTALPGERGNVGLAAHRDTFFRDLRNVKRNDLIRIESLSGVYQYQVESIRVVTPDQVEVLDAWSEPSLTLVTCYPFDFIGSAPERFIVRARQVKPVPVIHQGS